MNGRRRAPGAMPRIGSRHGSAVLTLAIHAALLGLILLPMTARSSKSEPRALTMFDMPGPQGPEAPPKPAQPTPVPPPPPVEVVVPPPIVPLPAPPDTVVALLETSAAQAAAGACDLTAPVQAALLASPAVQATLPQLPSPMRSVANTRMIWDADWVRFADMPDDGPRDTIRDAIAGVVASASDACRLQPQRGPRLLILPREKDTVILALGSGDWRWQALLDTARPDGWVVAEPEIETATGSEKFESVLASLTAR